MNNQQAVKFVHEQLNGRSRTGENFPQFRAGDNITVSYRIVEGGKERIQLFKGDVIKRQGCGYTQTFTVRKVSEGVGVERLFPLYSSSITAITLNKRGLVSQARIYYIRARRGKKARIKGRTKS